MAVAAWVDGDGWNKPAALVLPLRRPIERRGSSIHFFIYWILIKVHEVKVVDELESVQFFLKCS
jgi:hypothetical protein